METPMSRFADFQMLNVFNDLIARARKLPGETSTSSAGAPPPRPPMALPTPSKPTARASRSTADPTATTPTSTAPQSINP
jgi:hypothetical protein